MLTTARKPSRTVQPAVSTLEVVIVGAVLRRCTDRYTTGPLAAVLDDVRQVLPCTMGQYHDALRQLHSAGKIRLEPWTRAPWPLAPTRPPCGCPRPPRSATRSRC